MKKDFLSIADYSREELEQMLNLAIELKKEWKNGGNEPVLKNKVMAMIFQKPSLRTRVSFDMAMRHLGGDALYLSPAEIGLGKRESVADVARVISGYVDIIMARVFDHAHVLELAEYANIPVINGLSDFNHPCQALADALTILEKKGKVAGQNVVFVGDGNNVAISLMYIVTRLGANFTMSNPSGYAIPQDAIDIAKAYTDASGASLNFISDPAEAVENADVIYTDTWTSMGQEEEAEKRIKIFQPYQVNQELVSKAKSDVIVMHCLPAHRGQELTDEVADGTNSVIFPQAHNRLHAQKAIIHSLLR